MIHLVTGGSASGKSAYAERLLTADPKENKPFLYLATMETASAEAKERIHRHQAQRAGKGFVTLERLTDLSHLTVPDNAGILLECVPNLVANELFLPDGSMREADAVRTDVLSGITHLAQASPMLVVVTGEAGADKGDYAPPTEAYRALLGRVNVGLGELADTVTEVVCGIPNHIKGPGSRKENFSWGRN